MSFPGTLEKAGILTGQHHDRRWSVPVRDVPRVGRQIGRDEYGNYIYEEDSIGDLLGFNLWKKSSRENSGWMHAWPARLTGGDSERAEDGPGGGIPAPEFAEGGPGATVAQEDAGKGHCRALSGNGSLLPIFDAAWTSDDRFEEKDPNFPPGFPKIHRSSYGILLSGTDEYAQHDLFFPIDPRLVAVNNDGDPKMASHVYDLKDNGEIDDDRGARLQSMVWVVKEPSGGANALSWNIGKSGCKDVDGGYVIDDSSGKKVLARVSTNQGGPLDVGTGKCKHKIGEDADGNPIDSCHISTKALFRRNDVEDGPFFFEGQYEEPDEQPYRSRVHLEWGGVKWRWRAEIPITLVPMPTPVPVPTDPRGPSPATVNPRPTGLVPSPAALTGIVADAPTLVGGSVPASDFTDTPTDVRPPPVPSVDEVFEKIRKEMDQRARTIVPTQIGMSAGNAMALMSNVLASPGLLAAPQNFDSEMLDSRYSSSISEEQSSKVENTTPVCGGMSSFGAQGGTVGDGYGAEDVGGEHDPWVYTQRPGSSKYKGGTASGGFVFHPPEVGPEDIINGFVANGVTTSTTYVVTAPGAWFGAGIPELANGSIRDGYSWGMDSATADLVFRTHSDGGTPDNAIRFNWSTQNIEWYSFTDFLGILDHTNTADRTYTFPDASITVAGGTGAANQVAYWSATNVLAGDAGLTYDAAADALSVSGRVNIGTVTDASAVGDLAVGLTGAARTFYDQSAQLHYWYNSGGTIAVQVSAVAATPTIFNEQGVDIDLRVEGDNKVNCLLLDASDDEVAIDGRFSLVALTPAQLTANQDNYDPESTATNRSSFWRLSSDASRNVTGIANGLDGRILKLVNVGANSIVIQNENAGSLAANRIITGTGADITLAADDTMDLIYDNTTQRWRVMA